MLSKISLNKAYRYAISLTNDPVSGSDLLQSSIEKFLRSGRSDDPDLKPAFLYRIIRNNYIDLRRKKSELLGNWEDASDESVSHISQRSLEDIYIFKEDLNRILNQLNDFERELIYLHLVEEYTIDEISEMTEKPRGTLLSMMFRIRKKISSDSLKENPTIAGGKP